MSKLTGIGKLNCYTAIHRIMRDLFQF